MEHQKGLKNFRDQNEKNLIMSVVFELMQQDSCTKHALLYVERFESQSEHCTSH